MQAPHLLSIHSRDGAGSSSQIWSEWALFHMWYTHSRPLWLAAAVPVRSWCGSAVSPAPAAWPGWSAPWRLHAHGCGPPADTDGAEPSLWSLDCTPPTQISLGCSQDVIPNPKSHPLRKTHPTNTANKNYNPCSIFHTNVFCFVFYRYCIKMATSMLMSRDGTICFLVTIPIRY